MSDPLRVSLGWDNFAVPHMDRAVAILGGLWIVRDHQHSLPQFLVGLAQHPQNNLRVLGVEVAGRLVGQHDCRLVDQGPR